MKLFEKTRFGESPPTIPVRYNEDGFIKNKRMFRIPMLSLFLTCTENSLFYLEYTYLSGSMFAHWLKKEKQPTYLGRQSFFHGGKFPSTQVPCSKSTASAPLAFLSPPSPPTPTSSLQSIYFLTYKDDINKPDSSIGHNSLFCKFPLIIQLN